MSGSDRDAPTKEDRFSFGLWTVGNPGRDPFGAPVRVGMSPVHIVEGLAACGAWGVNLHDEDLVPFGASAAERDRIVREFRAALDASGMVVPIAMEAGKLFHVDLNVQRIGRYDQDLRFGSEDPRQAFLLVRLLEGTAGGERYEGPRHFDAHAYRTEDEHGVWDFARGCMRTYKILAERAAALDADPEVRDLIAAPRDERLEALARAYSAENAARLRSMPLDIDGPARRGLRYERLDQLMTEHLLGARGA